MQISSKLMARRIEKLEKATQPPIEWKFYSVLKPIMIPFDTVRDENGSFINPSAISDGIVQLDPGHSATISWAGNDCIKLRSGR